jgi:RNA polymerase sigma-70 factor (ECF subfamily)
MRPVNHDAFERTYSEHAEPLLAFLTYRTGDRALAEDLLAETFEKVLTTRRRFDPRRASEKTWLYSIALNRVRDSARRRAAETRAMEKVSAPVGDQTEDPLAQIDARDAVGRALAVLTAEEREAVALRYGSDLTVPEIAKLLHEPLTTMEGRLYRALRKMRSELG